MMTKIIGFLITKEKKDITVDFLNTGIRCIKLNHANYTIYLWGIGDIENYKIKDKYSLSFPLSDSLLDRNVLIYFSDNEIVIENDWLGSIPVFYNPKEKIVSTIPNFCIKDKVINSEGLANFCEFGYSVFEQTFFENVKFMRYYSKLIVTNDLIRIQYKNDPILEVDFLSKQTTTDEVISKIKDYINNIEGRLSGEIIIPTSGGYDSRLLNYLIKDKSKIRSFTYGISTNQSKSYEVVHAKRLSEILNTKWEQIELTDFYRYIEEWFDIYGISTHLHGMYHIEFYKKILEKRNFNNPTLLSGIFGDVWSGSINYKEIKGVQDIINLAYTHGVNMELKYLKINYTNYLKEKFFLEYGKHLQCNKIKAIATVRMKLILISYLLQIPEYFGIPAWTPFLNFEIVTDILALPEEQRKNRVWERDYFRTVGLNLEDMNLFSVKSNTLDYEIAKKSNFEPIDNNLMKEYIDEDRIKKINNILKGLKTLEAIKNQLLYVPKVGGILRRLGFKNEFLKALYEYYIVKAVEKGLKYDS